MKNTYSMKTKEVTTVTSVEEFRCIGLGLAIALGGPPLAAEMLQGIVQAADETTTDEDYENKVESLFQHVRDEHIDGDNDLAKTIVDMLESMAKALPRTIVIAEHFRQLNKLGKMGAGAGESFNA